ncbi:MAG: hypothetical protein MHM6MM_005951 [Cercozoa sp. M6MM]
MTALIYHAIGHGRRHVPCNREEGEEVHISRSNWKLLELASKPRHQLALKQLLHSKTAVLHPLIRATTVLFRERKPLKLPPFVSATGWSLRVRLSAKETLPDTVPLMRRRLSMIKAYQTAQREEAAKIRQLLDVEWNWHLNDGALEVFVDTNPKTPETVTGVEDVNRVLDWWRSVDDTLDALYKVQTQPQLRASLWQLCLQRSDGISAPSLALLEEEEAEPTSKPREEALNFIANVEIGTDVSTDVYTRIVSICIWNRSQTQRSRLLQIRYSHRLFCCSSLTWECCNRRPVYCRKSLKRRNIAREVSSNSK